MNNARTAVIFLIGLLLSVFSFHTAWSQDGASARDGIKSGAQPSWVEKKPVDDGRFMYFVGMGASAKGNLTEAYGFATDDIRSQILGFIGVRVSSESVMAATGDLNDFQASISKQIKESSAAYLAGLQVREAWSRTNANLVTVYVLVSYETASILKEKKRLADVIDAMVNAVKIPEEAGIRLAGEGRYFEAALRYIEAAVAASESILEDAAVALNRTLAGALDSLGKINLVKLNDNLSGAAGEEPAEPFKLKAAAGGTADTKGIPKTVVLVTYYESGGGSDLRPKSLSLACDEEGLLAFRHPVLTFVGRGKVSMQLDINAYLDKLAKAEKKAPEKVTALKKLVFAKKQEFQFTALAQAKKLPLAVFVVDVDENGNPLKNHQSTASGINEALSKQGFTLKIAVLNPALAGNSDQDELANLILAKVPGMERAVVGTAAVESFYQDGERYIVKVVGSVKVIELKTKRVLYEKSQMKSYTGAALEATKTAAFKQLGRDLGQKIGTDTK